MLVWQRRQSLRFILLKRMGSIVLLGVSLLMGFPASLLHGQSFTLSGSVKDGYTGSPLDAALVEIIATQNGHRDSVYTNQNGEWSLVLTSVREAPANIPSAFHVFPNSPNPFHPPTQLRFFTPRAGRVDLTVYNVLGQQLDAVSAVLNAGEYAVQWGGKGGRGILFYSIVMNGARFTGKMVQLADGKAGLGNIVRGERALQAESLAKPAQQEYQFFVSKFAYEPDTLVQSLSGDTRLDFVLDTIHRRALVIDLHNDVLEKWSRPAISSARATRQTIPIFRAFATAVWTCNCFPFGSARLVIPLILTNRLSSSWRLWIARSSAIRTISCKFDTLLKSIKRRP